MRRARAGATHARLASSPDSKYSSRPSTSPGPSPMNARKRQRTAAVHRRHIRAWPTTRSGRAAAPNSQRARCRGLKLAQQQRHDLWASRPRRCMQRAAQRTRPAGRRGSGRLACRRGRGAAHVLPNAALPRSAWRDRRVATAAVAAVVAADATLACPGVTAAAAGADSWLL
eukprot:364942-Chlamydomonas_euryale.AAC.10